MVWLPLETDGRNYGTYEAENGLTFSSTSPFTDNSFTSGTCTFYLPTNLIYTRKAITVSFFMMSKSTTPSQDGWIWQFGNNTTNCSRGLWLSKTGNKISWGEAGTDIQMITGDNFTSLYDQKWHHICCRMYYRTNWCLECLVDGVFLCRITPNEMSGASSSFVFNTSVLNAYVKHLKVYDECLSDVEIHESLSVPDFVFDVETGVDISANGFKTTKLGAVGAATSLSVVKGNNTGYYKCNEPYEIDYDGKTGFYCFSIVADIYVGSQSASTPKYNAIVRSTETSPYLWFGTDTDNHAVWASFGNATIYTAPGSSLGVGAHTIVVTFARGTCKIYIDGYEQIVYSENSRSYLGAFKKLRLNAINDGSTSSSYAVQSNTSVSRVRFYSYNLCPKAVEFIGKPKPTVLLGGLDKKSKVITCGSVSSNASKISIGHKEVNSVDMTTLVYDVTTGYCYYPLIYQVCNATNGPWFTTDNYTTQAKYVSDQCWSRLHLLNSSVSGNILSSVFQYEFMVLQGNLNGDLTRIRWKQTSNPIGSTYANVSPTSGNITKYENDSQGGIYAVASDRMIFHANATNGNSFGMMHRCAWQNGTLPCFNNAVLSGDIVQILLVKVSCNNIETIPNAHLFNTGQLDISSVIEIQ